MKMLAEAEQRARRPGGQLWLAGLSPSRKRAVRRSSLGSALGAWSGQECGVFSIEVECDPAEAEKGAPSGTQSISFYCDDIEKTVAELKSRGVEFTQGIVDQGYGLVTHFMMPGKCEVQLYQPRYTKKSSPK